MSEAAVKQEPNLDDLISSLTSDDFTPGTPTERLQQAIDAHGGSFREAVAEIRQQYAAMIDAAGEATHDELLKFRMQKGLSSPQVRRRVENACKDGIERGTVDGIRPPLMVIINDLIRAEEERRERLAERERKIDQQEQQEADAIRAAFKVDTDVETLSLIYARRQLGTNQELEKLEGPLKEAQKEEKRILDSGDGKPVEKYRLRSGAVVTELQASYDRPEKLPPEPWTKLETARRKVQDLANQRAEAQLRLGFIRQLGTLIVQWPGFPTITGPLEARLARVFGQAWHRRGPLGAEEAFQSDGAFRDIVIESAPKQSGKKFGVI